MPELTTAELELVYDHLAQAIDQVGSEQVPLYLTKLALLSAEALGSVQIFVELSDKAMQDV
jgi:phage FluMu protein gp41